MARGVRSRPLLEPDLTIETVSIPYIQASELTPDLQVTRDSDGRFLKGYSGNPQGPTPRTTATEILRKYSDPHEMAQIMWKHIRAGRTDLLVYCFDRLDGRPVQATVDVSEDSPAALAMRELAAEMRAARLADQEAEARVPQLEAGK